MLKQMTGDMSETRSLHRRWQQLQSFHKAIMLRGMRDGGTAPSRSSLSRLPPPLLANRIIFRASTAPQIWQEPAIVLIRCFIRVYQIILYLQSISLERSKMNVSFPISETCLSRPA